MDKPTRITSRQPQKNSNIISKTIKNTMQRTNTVNLNMQRAAFGGISKDAKEKFYAKKDKRIMPLTASTAPKPSIMAVKDRKKSTIIGEAFSPHGRRSSGRYVGRGGYSRPHRNVVRNYYNSGYGGGYGGYGGWGLSYPYVYPVEVPVTVDTSEAHKQRVKNEIKEELRRDMSPPIRSNTVESQIIMVLIALGLGAILYKVFTK
jgi:hypothetical protein